MLSSGSIHNPLTNYVLYCRHRTKRSVCLMVEEWKSLTNIVECGLNYEVSNLGNVRNKSTKKVLKYRKTQKGYCTVMLYDNGSTRQYLVHRLVALAFIANLANKQEVNHKDGVKTNCSVDNLEWATPKENMQHAFEHGLASPTLGSNRSNALISEEEVKEVKNWLIERVSAAEIGRRLGISRHIVDAIKKGRSWTHVHVEGFTPFKYDRKGESVRSSKLTADDVVKIRELHATGKYSFRKISQMYNVYPKTVGDIVKRVAWKHVK